MSNWLNTIMKARGIDKKLLSGFTNVDLEILNDFEKCDTINDFDSFYKVISFFNRGGNYSYDSEDLIKELENDLKYEINENTFLYAFFEIRIDDTKIFLTNYYFIVDEKPLTKEERLNVDLIVKMKAKDILKIMKKQNEIFGK